MKVLASLFRVVFSIIVLLALACYAQMSPTVTLGNFCASIEPAELLATLSGFNAVTVSLVIILLLGICSFTRILEAAWNIIFCASVLILLATGLYVFCGSAVALPQALAHNTAVTQVCSALTSYEVPIAITTLIFIAGWLCASACGRVAITAIVSHGLWYGVTVFLTFIVHQWANSANPNMPEALHMVQGSPWVIAAVPGAFFLIYALFMAFFETFIQNKEKKEAVKADDKKSAADSRKDEQVKKDPESKTEETTKEKSALKVQTPVPAKKLNVPAPTTVEKKEEQTSEPAAETKQETAQAATSESTEPAATEAQTEKKQETPTMTSETGAAPEDNEEVKKTAEEAKPEAADKAPEATA